MLVHVLQYVGYDGPTEPRAVNDDDIFGMFCVDGVHGVDGVDSALNAFWTSEQETFVGLWYPQ